MKTFKRMALAFVLSAFLSNCRLVSWSHDMEYRRGYDRGYREGYSEGTITDDRVIGLP